MNKILPIELKKSKYKITPYGGLLLVYESILGLGLDKQVERELPRPGSNRGFRPGEYTVPLMLMQHAGGRELEDMGKLRTDQILKDVLKQAKTKGKGVIPSRDAAGDWLRRMGGKKTAGNNLPVLDVSKPSVLTAPGIRPRCLTGPQTIMPFLP